MQSSGFRIWMTIQTATWWYGEGVFLTPNIASSCRLQSLRSSTNLYDRQSQLTRQLAARLTELTGKRLRQSAAVSSYSCDTMPPNSTGGQLLHTAPLKKKNDRKGKWEGGGCSEMRPGVSQWQNKRFSSTNLAGTHICTSQPHRGKHSLDRQNRHNATVQHPEQ